MYNVQSDVSIERRLQDAVDEIKYVTIAEGSPLVRFKISDGSILAIDIDTCTLAMKLPNGKIEQKRVINDSEIGRKWLNLAIKKKRENTGEVYR